MQLLPRQCFLNLFNLVRILFPVHLDSILQITETAEIQITKTKKVCCYIKWELGYFIAQITKLSLKN